MIIKPLGRPYPNARHMPRKRRAIAATVAAADFLTRNRLIK